MLYAHVVINCNYVRVALLILSFMRSCLVKSNATFVVIIKRIAHVLSYIYLTDDWTLL